MNKTKESRHRCAVYPGTFDPIHNGHIDIIHRCVEIFDEVIVAVADQPRRGTVVFTPDERVALIRESIRDLKPRAQVDKFSGLSVEYAERIGAKVIICSLRGITDFEYKIGVAHMNKYMKPNVETIFLLANPALSFSASHLIKEVAAYGQRLPALVPPPVMQRLCEKFRLD